MFNNFCYFPFIFIQLFCTVSDCNLDYSSPNNFNSSARAILHIGEFRITSNLIEPSGPIQTYKISLGNLSLHLLNKRDGHSTEDSRISCNRLFQNNKRKKSVPLPHSLDDALFRMGFIAVGSLDFLDAALTVASSEEIQISSIDELTAPHADVTVALSFGEVGIYACKDSFLCLTDALNELSLHLTMPTHEELELQRTEYFSKQQTQLDTHELPFYDKTEDISNVSHPDVDVDIVQNTFSLSEVMNQDLFSDNISHSSEDSCGNNNIDLNIGSTTNAGNYNNQAVSCQIGTGFAESEHAIIDDFYEVSNHDKHKRLQRSSTIELTDCWTTIDHPWCDDQTIPEGKEQSSQWYDWDGEEKYNTAAIPHLMLPNGSSVIIEGKTGHRKPRIFNRHIPLKASSDPLSGGDMRASLYADSKKIQVQLRILVTDLSLNCRMFDGNDFPPPPTKIQDEKQNNKNRLLGALMGGTDESNSTSIFSDTVTDASLAFSRMNVATPRQAQKYFQFSFSGLKLRLDSFHQSEEHFLSSCIELNFTEMHLIDVISSDKPVKMLGEWVNEDEHPRDSNDGLLTMKVRNTFAFETIYFL